MIPCQHSRQIEQGGGGRSRFLNARTSPLGLILAFGKGRSSFTASDIRDTGCRFTMEKIDDAIQSGVKSGRVKVIRYGVYRLTGEV